MVPSPFPFQPFPHFGKGEGLGHRLEVVRLLRLVVDLQGCFRIRDLETEVVPVASISLWSPAQAVAMPDTKGAMEEQIHRLNQNQCRAKVSFAPIPVTI
jgi:hypothetical protein